MELDKTDKINEDPLSNEYYNQLIDKTTNRKQLTLVEQLNLFTKLGQMLKKHEQRLEVSNRCLGALVRRYDERKTTIDKEELSFFDDKEQCLKININPETLCANLSIEGPKPSVIKIVKG